MGHFSSPRHFMMLRLRRFLRAPPTAEACVRRSWYSGWVVRGTAPAPAASLGPLLSDMDSCWRCSGCAGAGPAARPTVLLLLIALRHQGPEGRSLGWKTFVRPLASLRGRLGPRPAPCRRNSCHSGGGSAEC